MASPSKQLFHVGHSLPQLRGCRWDLLCCRERAGASWEPPRPFIPKVLLPRWQGVSSGPHCWGVAGGGLWPPGSHRLLSPTFLACAVLPPPPSHLYGSDLCSVPTIQSSPPYWGSRNVFLIKTSINAEAILLRRRGNLWAPARRQSEPTSKIQLGYWQHHDPTHPTNKQLFMAHVYSKHIARDRWC